MSFFGQSGKATEDVIDLVALLVRPERRNPSVFGPECLCLDQHHHATEDLVQPVDVDRDSRHHGHRDDAPAISPRYVACVEPEKRALTASSIPGRSGIRFGHFSRRDRDRHLGRQEARSQLTYTFISRITVG